VSSARSEDTNLQICCTYQHGRNAYVGTTLHPAHRCAMISKVGSAPKGSWCNTHAWCMRGASEGAWQTRASFWVCACGGCYHTVPGLRERSLTCPCRESAHEEEEASLQGGKGQGWVLTAPPRTPKKGKNTKKQQEGKARNKNKNREKAGEDTPQTRKRRNTQRPK